MRWIKTKHPGVRYREHETRKNGVGKDRYFTIRYKLGGKDKEESLGWASEGWTAEKAAHVLADLKRAAALGEGPKTLAEKRRISREKEAEKQVEQEKLAKDSLKFDTFFTDSYLPLARADKKPRSVGREEGLYKKWIKEVIGNFTMKEIAPFHLEKLKKSMMDGGQSPRSIEYALAVVRQIFNTARRLGVYEGEAPTAHVKSPKVDNGRMRFLIREEADALLDALAKKSIDVHDMTLLSLHCGLRFGEIATLTWQDVDLDKGVLTIRDAKAGSRYAFLTTQVAEILKNRQKKNPSDFVFSGRKGKLDRISYTFGRVIDQLGFNKGIDDPRLQICFHSCRHTHASWLIEEGQDLYTVQRLLGHKTNVMTQRYAHLSEDRLKNAIRSLGDALAKKPADVVDVKKAE